MVINIDSDEKSEYQSLDKLGESVIASVSYNEESEILILDLPIKIRSKSNYRKGKYDWSKEKIFSETIYRLTLEYRDEIKKFKNEGEFTECKPYYCISVVSWSKFDAANTSKSLLDALEGVLYDNDKSILGVSSFNLPINKERILILIKKISQGEDIPNANDVIKNSIDINNYIKLNYNFID